MRAGGLRRRFELQSQSSSRSASGASVVSYTTIATVWGALEMGRGAEFFAAQKVTAERTGRIRIRFRSGLNSRMRVKMLEGGSSGLARVFGVEGVVDPADRRRELFLYVREMPNGEPV